MGERYTYVVVRKDLKKEHMTPQACHAALESGREFPNPVKSQTYIVILTIENEEELLKFEKLINQNGIKTANFWEPDWNYGYTAFATEPIGVENRHHFKHLPLMNI